MVSQSRPEILRSLFATPKELQKLREKLRPRIHAALDLSKHDYVDFVSSSVEEGREEAYHFTCEQHGEVAQDNKGFQIPVLEFANGRGWRALMGVSVSWLKLSQTRYRFAGCQLILFFSASAQPQPGRAKQVMRLEWEPLDRNNNYDHEIAHPHWQMDLASFATVKNDDPPSVYASTIADAPLDTPLLTSFAPPAPAPDLAWSSKLHLAASARWMSSAWTEERPVPHVSGPQSMDDILSWMTSSCRYVRWQVEKALSD
jgi:hypothetical protein